VVKGGVKDAAAESDDLCLSVVAVYKVDEPLGSAMVTNVGWT